MAYLVMAYNPQNSFLASLMCLSKWIDMSIHSSMTIRMSICMSIHASIHMAVHMPVHMSILISMNKSKRMSINMSIPRRCFGKCLHACLHTHLQMLGISSLWYLWSNWSWTFSVSGVQRWIIDSSSIPASPTPSLLPWVRTCRCLQWRPQMTFEQQWWPWQWHSQNWVAHADPPVCTCVISACLLFLRVDA